MTTVTTALATRDASAQPRSDADADASTRAGVAHAGAHARAAFARPPAGPARPRTLAWSHANALAWLGPHALALWPHGRWVVARAHDGSDDPLGVIALAALVGLVVRQRQAMRVAPRRPWLAAACVLTLSATLALGQVPPLVAGVMGALALACGIAAWLPGGAARLPFAGLALLALPVVSSLQFYAGYPLRLVTAHASAWLLRGVGYDAQPSGAAMTVNGTLVIVDAPCSGVQMVWMAYFAACAMAALRDVREGTFVRRLPWIGLIVLAVNTARNSVLVTLEARPEGLAPAAHEAIGLAALAVATAAVAFLMQRPDRA